MSQDPQHPAPPDTPGYTGRYVINHQGLLITQQPDGVWVGTGYAYEDFKTKPTEEEPK